MPESTFKEVTVGRTGSTCVTADGWIDRQSACSCRLPRLCRDLRVFCRCWIAEPLTTAADLAFGNVNSSLDRWLKGNAS